LIFLPFAEISVGQNNADSVRTDSLNPKKKEKRKLFSFKKGTTVVENNFENKNSSSDTIVGKQTIKKTSGGKKTNKSLSKEGRRKVRVQKKYNRKLVWLTKRCKLNEKEKSVMNKSQGMKLSPSEKTSYKKACRKLDKYEIKSRLYEKKRHYKIQDKKTKKMMKQNKNKSSKDRKNEQKFNRNNGIFPNKKD
jgi:hypothetical protein